MAAIPSTVRAFKPFHLLVCHQNKHCQGEAGGCELANHAIYFKGVCCQILHNKVDCVSDSLYGCCIRDVANDCQRRSDSERSFTFGEHGNAGTPIACEQLPVMVSSGHMPDIAVGSHDGLLQPRPPKLLCSVFAPGEGSTRVLRQGAMTALAWPAMGYLQSRGSTRPPSPERSLAQMGWPRRTIVPKLLHTASALPFCAPAVKCLLACRWAD